MAPRTPHPFDPGYGDEPFRTLCAAYPGPDVYPPADFRVEWGPVFHRGRLDGTARVLILGQDPAAHEAVVRRILVGTAGHRVQGFLAKLGVRSRYVLVNTFLYSVYGQGGGARHANDPAIAAYRHRWLDALLAGTDVRAVLALGGLADTAWRAWRATPNGAASTAAYVKVTHPTQPESSSKGDRVKHAAATATLLANWNAALDVLEPALAGPGHAPGRRYGTAFARTDLAAIPARDLPAGIPEWMGRAGAWATRTGADAREKRRTLVAVAPAAVVPASVVPASVVPDEGAGDDAPASPKRPNVRRAPQPPASRPPARAARRRPRGSDRPAPRG